MAERFKKHRGSIPNGTAIAQNVEFFSSDLGSSARDPYASTMIVLGAFTVSRVLEFSLDSGATWISAGARSTVFNFEIDIIAGETLQFRTPDAAGVVIQYFRVVEQISN